MFDPTCTIEEQLDYVKQITWHRTNKHIINTILRNRFSSNSVLDVGERNPRTEFLEDRFKCKIDSTNWDLDYYRPLLSSKKYKSIIFACVIEHLYNPLTCLNSLYPCLRKDGKMLIVVPQFKKLTSSHFHQIPDSRMRGLLDKANFKVLEYYQFNNPFKFHQHLKGVRPLLRYFNRKVGVYVVQNKWI